VAFFVRVDFLHDPAFTRLKHSTPMMATC